jgi:hypothetical protein
MCCKVLENAGGSFQEVTDPPKTFIRITKNFEKKMQEFPRYGVFTGGLLKLPSSGM